MRYFLVQFFILARRGIVFLSLFLFSAGSLAKNPSIYSRHWFGRLPLIKGDKNLLLIHDIFIISFDQEKKFPTWVAYRLSPDLVWGDIKADRKYIPDPLLGPSLNFKDYKGASHCDGKKSGYDKGHLAPLGSFKASAFIYQAQYLSNIVPQSRALNQGPWRKLEERIRSFVKKGHSVRILTGPIYGKEGKDKIPPCWKAAQGKIQEIPHSYWKIVAFRKKSKIKFCPFLMPQKIKSRKETFTKYKAPLDQIEKKAGLDIFSGLKPSPLPDCEFLF